MLCSVQSYLANFPTGEKNLQRTKGGRKEERERKGKQPERTRKAKDGKKERNDNIDFFLL